MVTGGSIHRSSMMYTSCAMKRMINVFFIHRHSRGKKPLVVIAAAILSIIFCVPLKCTFGKIKIKHLQAELFTYVEFLSAK